MSIKFACVNKQDVPRNTRMVYGKYAKFFDQLLDLGKNDTAAVAVEAKTEGYCMTQELRSLAKKEGFELGWSRSKDHKTFYYWLERKAEPIRRTA